METCATFLALLTYYFQNDEDDIVHEICTCLGFKSTLEDNLKVSRMLSQFGEVLLKNRFLNQVKSKEDLLVVRCIFGLAPIIILNILNKFYN